MGERRRWVDEDVELLRGLVSKMSSRKAAEVMGRSHASVRKAMDRFKIKGVPQHLWYSTLTEDEKAARTKRIKDHVPRKYATQEEGKRERQRDRLVSLYLQVFEALGGRCAVCKTDEAMILEVDHVKGDGAVHRAATAKGIPYVQELLRVAREEPGRLQLLCANDHRRKRRRESGWLTRLPDDS